MNSVHIQLINVDKKKKKKKRKRLKKMLRNRKKIRGKKKWMKRTRWNFIMHIWNQPLKSDCYSILYFFLLFFCRKANKHFTILIIKRFHWMSNSNNNNNNNNKQERTRYVHVNVTWLNWCSSCIHVNKEMEETNRKALNDMKWALWVCERTRGIYEDEQKMKWKLNVMCLDIYMMSFVPRTWI